MEKYLKPGYHAVGGLTEWHNIKCIYSSDLSSGKKAELLRFGCGMIAYL